MADLLRIRSYQAESLDDDSGADGNKLLRYASESDDEAKPIHSLAREPVDQVQPPATRRVTIEMELDDASERRLRHFISGLITKE